MALKTPTPKQLAAWLAKWRSILRLQDWNITAKFVRAPEFTDLGRLGQLSVLEKKRVAIVRIATAEDYQANPGDFGVSYDPELALVHELCHVHFWPLHTKDDSPELTAEEQAVHALSCALVALDRR